MTKAIFKAIGLGLKAAALAGLLCSVGAAQDSAQDKALRAKYPKMAPLAQYEMDSTVEIALARSAAPAAISRDADVMVLGAKGFETAVKGTNGFVCLVERGWSAGESNPEFWNPKIRGPICLNAPAVKTYLPLAIKKTELALAGLSQAQIFEKVLAAYANAELPPQAPGAMSFMLSKQQFLGDRNGHWAPHLMFFAPPTPAKMWGADVEGSPLMADEDSFERLTIFLIPVGKWSDGTPASSM